MSSARACSDGRAAMSRRQQCERAQATQHTGVLVHQLLHGRCNLVHLHRRHLCMTRAPSQMRASSCPFPLPAMTELMVSVAPARSSCARPCDDDDDDGPANPGKLPKKNHRQKRKNPQTSAQRAALRPLPLRTAAQRPNSATKDCFVSNSAHPAPPPCCMQIRCECGTMPAKAPTV